MMTLMCIYICVRPYIGAGHGMGNNSVTYSSIIQTTMTAFTPLLSNYMPFDTNGRSAMGRSKGTTEKSKAVRGTKLRVIEIIEFLMNQRLHLRITNLLSIFKQLYEASEKSTGKCK